MTNIPYIWMGDPARPIINIHRERPKLHIYGEVVWAVERLCVRFDGRVFSVYDNERMALTTDNPKRVQQFFDWLTF